MFYEKKPKDIATKDLDCMPLKTGQYRNILKEENKKGATQLIVCTCTRSTFCIGHACKKLGQANFVVKFRSSIFGVIIENPSYFKTFLHYCWLLSCFFSPC